MGFLFSLKQNRSADTASADQLLSLAKSGDAGAREELIRRFIPLILRSASRVTGRYVRIGQDDEASVGMIAFNEAIDSFDPNKSTAFLTFAEVVIRRRLIDHFRRESVRPEIPLTALDQEDAEGNVDNPAEKRQALELYLRSERRNDYREEIVRFTEMLREYGISFNELAAISPKHEDARIRAIQAARLIAGNPEWADHLRARKELPLKDLEKKANVSRKTLERQRKYIIAITLILTEDLYCLRDYLNK